MTSLAHKLQDVIVQHVKQASPDELARLVGSFAANGAGTIQPIAPAPAVGTRRWGIGSNGSLMLEDEIGDHVAVYDPRTNLTWSRGNIGGKRMNWQDADAACRALDLAGHQDWRLPTIQELLSIVDYERKEPAIDTSLFDCEASWYWTSTPAAASPAVCAWIVSFGYGASGWYARSLGLFVRAVRPGQ